jgi:8-oxo-dGTP pyrophosphatase MutT (NUDIX family)
MEPVVAVPAATVIPLRDGPAGLETLMLKRNSKLEFAGGMWVWPGGRVETADHAAGTVPTAPALDDLDMLDAARRAAVREAAEEAGIALDPRSLVWLSHWTPPEMSPKRFSTWFFVAPAPEGVVEVDGGEIHDHAWWAPVEAMRRRDALEIELSPPTWITLVQLARFATTAQALATLAAETPEPFATRLARAGGEPVLLYHGDVGYDDGDRADDPGPHHRLWMRPDGWSYIRTS